MMNETGQSSQGGSDVRVLLTGPDTLYFSFDVSISDAMRAQLKEEKQAAQVAASAGGVHYPAWLGARVLPTGARGGYALLVETEHFTVKLLGAGIPNRPGIYLELHTSFLHVHPAASARAVLLLEFKPAYSIGDRLTQHLDALEQEAEDKGGLHDLLAHHFAKVYRVTPSRFAA
jgi:hypothetical protein